MTGYFAVGYPLKDFQATPFYVSYCMSFEVRLLLVNTVIPCGRFWRRLGPSTFTAITLDGVLGVPKVEMAEEHTGRQ